MSLLPPDSPAYRVLREVFGYTSFRAGQEAVIACLLDGTSVLTVMPTGAGKSLCFQVPALVRDGLPVVVSPLVALMEDQVAALKLDGVAADSINSSRDRQTKIGRAHVELQSLMRIPYAVFCLKKNNHTATIQTQNR